MPKNKQIFVSVSQRERADALVLLMKSLTGIDARERNRRQSTADARTMIAAVMLNEGMPVAVVSQLLHRDHATVYHYRKKIDMFMNVPGYAAEREVWMKFRDAARNGAE